MKLTIDKEKITKAPFIFRGTGMVSANNSSRLLLDYKRCYPDTYEKLLRLIFTDEGLCVNHLKIELGSDINSSSGTEPCTKRFEDEKADTSRGAGFILAHDAKKVNPDLTLDMLRWSEPRWVTDSEDTFAARYKWYKETLNDAYERYGLKFDYVSTSQNERWENVDFVIYLSDALKNEKDCRYDFSKIKIVSGDEVCTWNIADLAMENEQLRNRIDVFGSHYTSFSSDNAKILAEKYKKELWFSESSTPMRYTEGAMKFTEGFAGINGLLDIADRFIAMYAEGKMTLCEYQPVIAAYYDGVTYSHKQFITANTPWNGCYTLDSGFFMQLHFSKLIKKGWGFIDKASHCDGKVGGDGHCLVDTKYSYLTAASFDADDFSTVITNNTNKPITYDFEIKGFGKNKIYVTESKKELFKLRESFDFKDSFSVTVNPYSIVTVSTLNEKFDENLICKKENTVMYLPYDQGAKTYFFTDQGGAFEEENDYIIQRIAKDMKPVEWGYTPSPTTNFGDDRWSDYGVSADVLLCDSEDNYAGVGLRYILASEGESGYYIKLFKNGKWLLCKNKEELISGNASDIDFNKWINLKIEAVNNVISVYVNDNLLIKYTDEGSFVNSGRAALYSDYYNNKFRNINIYPKSEKYYVKRYSAADFAPENYKNLTYDFCTTFKNYKRILFKASEFEFDFNGKGFCISGYNEEDSKADVIIDGKDYKLPIKKSGYRETSLFVSGLENTNHRVKITGNLSFDSVEIEG